MQNSRDKEGRPIYNPELPSYNPKDKEATSKYRIPKLDEYGNQKARIREGKGTEYLWEKVTIPSNDWMIERMQKFGESLGQGIVINI